MTGPLTEEKKTPELVVTQNGVPLKDQAEGIRRFKEACLEAGAAKQAVPQRPDVVFPGTASMYASRHRLAVTEEWMRGWNACLDAIDRLGGFRRD